MSYNRYSYSSPYGSHSSSSSNYSSPTSRYSSSSTYDSSRSGLGSGLGGSGLSGSRSSLNQYSSSRYDTGGSSYTPRSTYTPSYTPSSYTPSYTGDYSRTSRTSRTSDYTPKSSGYPRSTYDSDYSSSRTSKKASRVSPDYEPEPRKSKSDKEVHFEKTERKSRRARKAEAEEGGSPLPTRSADVTEISKKTENLSVSSQSTAKPASPSSSPAKQATGSTATQFPHGEDGSVATKGKASTQQGSTDQTPICAHCNEEVRGPFVLALNKTWCPNHFTCAKCNSELVNMGFVELQGKIYCENDYETFFASKCAKCRQAIVGDTVNALEKTWHPKCFVCFECEGPISSGAFHVENGMPYCMKDWQRLFQTKCVSCQYPVEPGDKWIEALDANWHSECFTCTVCKAPLEGKPFYPKEGKPYCKDHAKA